MENTLMIILMIRYNLRVRFLV